MSTGSAGRPTRLLFDARYIRTDFHDGISRFSAELARAVQDAAVQDAASGAGLDVVFLIHDEAQRASLPEGARTLTIHAPTSWREPFTALILNRHRPDAVFSPMQTIGSLGRRFRLILTLHDTIYYRHRTPPRDLPAAVRFGWRLFHLSYLPQRLVLNRADVVATVSETSRRQFAAVRLTKRPVVVIANAPQDLAELLPAGRRGRIAARPCRLDRHPPSHPSRHRRGRRRGRPHARRSRRGTSSTWAPSCRTRTSRRSCAGWPACPSTRCTC
ncbi:glycosyltransferase [Leucobacter soli]|uniref:glycosyltransferase n=1 Tax=Leucobacter soli TaxID=2812850 RepID=UPI003611CAB3